MPGWWLSQYSFRKAGSVPSRCVTWYCCGVRRFLRSSSEGFVYVFMSPPSQRGAGVVAVDAVDVPAASPLRAQAATANTAAATSMADANRRDFETLMGTVSPGVSTII